MSLSINQKRKGHKSRMGNGKLGWNSNEHTIITRIEKRT